MGSAYFPVLRSHYWGQRLVAARDLIDSVVEAWIDSRFTTNGEDEARDSTFIADLREAKDKIDACLQVDKKVIAEVERQVELATISRDESAASLANWQSILDQLKKETKA